MTAAPAGQPGGRGLEHPDPGSLAPLLTALGADTEIKPAAAAALIARLSSPNGRTVLR